MRPVSARALSRTESITAADILRMSLQAPVHEVAEVTPLQRADLLSSRLQREVWLKREDLQAVHSFKLRGAHACLSALSPRHRERGVVAASAGNHAQGVALSARRLGLSATIVMPVTTPTIKVDAVRALGAEVMLEGLNYETACQRARAMADHAGRHFVHPFDDPLVIAGQATIGLELCRQWPDPPDAVYVPVGGGGLFAGIGSVLRTLYPDVRLIGVEPEDAACLRAALAHGGPVTLPEVGRFADGAAVATLGSLPYALIRDFVDEVITVNADEISAAIRDQFEDTRTLVEPAGALAVAGLKKHASEASAQSFSRVIAISSGANVDFDRLADTVERSVYGEDQEALFSVRIEEQAGSFLKFCRLLGDGQITEFNYRYSRPQHAQIFVGIRMPSAGGSRDMLIRHLEQHGYWIEDLSSNELARTHLRHLVGGIGPRLSPHRGVERFFSFEFPKQPGALLDFLTQLAGRWSISLFHYASRGAVHGRVLVAFIVPCQDSAEFERFIQSTGYRCTDEARNRIISQFLQASADHGSSPDAPCPAERSFG